MNYILAEQQKKSSGLKIGIFTVFLVVAIITMLESVIAVTPILFVKLGQEESGAVDFQLKFEFSERVSGDVNFYNVDPFVMNYTSDYSYQPLVGTAAPLNAARPLLRHTKKHLQQLVPDNFVVNNGDHFLINGQLNVLNFDWYNATFFGLEGFNGFTPRTIYPSSHFFNGLQTVTNLLLVIDCLQEAQIGLAPNFNPYILGKDEVMLGQTTADYLQLQTGEKVVMEFNLGTVTGSQQTKFLETSPLQRILGLLYSATNQDFPYEISQLASANLGDTF